MAAALGVLVPAGPVAAQVVGCTTASPGSLLEAGDPLLDAALKQAFEDTWDGVEPVLDPSGEKPVSWPDAKEQGGWIYRCWDSAGNEFTKVVPWPEGDYDSIDQGPKLDAGNCALIGTYHSHTGSKTGHPDNDGTPNEKPSDADEILADNDGLPGIIIHGHPNDPGSYGLTPYGPSAPSDGCPPDGDDDAAESAGEPHLRTFDAHPYDFQAAGEFVLVRSLDDDLQIQARQEPTATGHVTMNTAIAARVDGATVEVNETDVVIDGDATQRSRFDQWTTPGGGQIHNDGGVIRIRWSDGSEAAFVGAALIIDLADARAGRVEGLLGNHNGDPADDLVDGDGTALLADGRLTFAETYDSLAPAWRVHDETSLFTYPQGKSTADFVIEGIPAFPLTRGMLDPSRISEAEAACRAKGVTDMRRLDQCIFDVAVTGEESFAQEAAAVATQRERLTTADVTPLVEAASLQRIDQVGQLLATGMSPNGRDADGRTPLLAAVPTGNAALVRLLLEEGADPARAGPDSTTPLHLAAFWGFEEIVDALVATGADVAAIDNQDRTPADLAEAQGHAELARRLR